MQRRRRRAAAPHPVGYAAPSMPYASSSLASLRLVDLEIRISVRLGPATGDVEALDDHRHRTGLPEPLTFVLWLRCEVDAASGQVLEQTGGLDVGRRDHIPVLVLRDGEESVQRLDLICGHADGRGDG